MTPTWEPLLRRFGLSSVEEVYAQDAGTIVTQSGTSQVVQLELGEGPRKTTVYVKKYWFPTMRHRLRGMFRGTFFGQSKAPREFRNLVRLRELGLDAPVAVAFGEERKAGWLTRSFLISSGIENPSALDAFIQQILPIAAPARQTQMRRELIDNLARQTRRMHECRFVHHDYFWRNIILSKGSLERFYLIDAHKGHEWSEGSGERFRVMDLAALDAPAPWFFRRSERLRFFLRYRAHERLTADDKRLLREILDSAEPMRQAQRRRLRATATPSSSRPGSAPETLSPLRSRST